MRFLHSIRWRLQLWHGLLLALVLAGFGFTAWRLQWATQCQRLDLELEERIPMVANVMRARGGKPPGPPPRNAFPPPKPKPPNPERKDLEQTLPPDFEMPAPEAQRFAGDSAKAFYYVVWRRNGQELVRSASAPPDVPRPEGPAGGSAGRLRGTYRECLRFTPPGECLLVGRDIRDELADLHRLAWLLAGAGGVVLLLGLAGGWWVSTRALRPIRDISAAAARISGTDLTQRIRTADTDSELGQLAHVLNATFARLQTAFDRQVQFTADASHELRTPVSVVLTQTQTALNRDRSAAEYRESLAACHRAAQRMRQLIESLLTLARLDSGAAAATRERCDLDRITAEAVDLLRALAAEKGLTLELDLRPAVCAGQPGQLAQVVSNLVNNAICYNRPGGRVYVHVTTEANTAVLAVRDTGQGISPEDLPQLFERFFRADKARGRADGHTGLGLSITKAIVEGHGGSVQVASELGQGSVFTVRLPRLPDASERP